MVYPGINNAIYGSFLIYTNLYHLSKNTYIDVSRVDNVNASSATLWRPLDWIDLLNKENTLNIAWFLC